MSIFQDSPRGLQGVVFDCDGVLVASKEANKQYYNLILQGLGLSPMSSEQEDYMHMHTVEQSIQYIVPQEMLPQAEQVRARVSYKDIVSYVQIEEGLVDFLDFLHGCGVCCAVNTNRTNTMGLILQRFALEAYFNPVVTASSVEYPKPHPESLYLIMNQWRLKPEEIVFIGDSAVDEQTAHSAGVPFWAYKNNSLQAQRYINSFSQLKTLLEDESLSGYAPGKIA